MKHRMIAISGILLLFMLGGFFYINANSGANRDTVAKEHVIQYETVLPYDYAVPEELVGASHYVFVAKINGEVESDLAYRDANLPEGIEGTPMTTFSVTPLYNIKGELPLDNDVYLEEFYGYSEIAEGIVSYLDRDPIEPGSTYLVFARGTDGGRYSEDGFEILTAGTSEKSAQKVDYQREDPAMAAKTAMSDENNLSEDQSEENALLANEDTRALIDLYSDAYTREIPLAADVESGLDYNAFEKTSKLEME